MTTTAQNTTPPETPATQPTAVQSGGCALVNNYDWDSKIAYAVCMGESSGDPNTANWTDAHRDSDGNVICYGSFGLMQVGCIHGGEIYDPAENIAKAYAIYKDRASWDSNGWNAWGAYTDGRYLKYM